MVKKIFITGIPGIGKTTLIKKIINKLSHLKLVGFYTEEIREKGVRVGFKLIDLEGKEEILSHKDIKGDYRIGKYGVNIDGFENFLSSVPFFSNSTQIVIIDEIGKMECLSDYFRNILNELLESKKQLIATIAIKGGNLIERLKRRKDITLYTITKANRDSILSEILEEIFK